MRDPSLGPTVLGAMVDPRSAARVAELIKDAVQKGARVTAGGTGDGTLMQATVIDRVRRRCVFMQRNRSARW